MSGCAFSISSSSSTAVGMLADRRRPAARPARSRRSPGGAPISRATACFSMYSLMSKRDELVAEVQRELLGELGLADAGRAGEQEAAGGPVGLAEAGARALDRARDQSRPLRPGRTRRGRAIPRGSAGAPCRTTRPASPGCAPCARRLPRSAAAPTSTHRRRLGLAARPARAGRSARLRARLVEHVDGAVGQPVVAQVPRRELRRRLERVVGVLARGGAPRSATAAPAGSARSPGIDGSSIVIFCSRRASARSFSMCLNSSCVVEPTTRSCPAVRIGLISVARSIVPPVVAPAPTVEWISSMKRIGIGRLRERRDDRLEALLEVAAEARAGEQRRGVEREDLGALQQLGHVVLQQPRAPALRRARSCRRRRRRRTPGCSCGGGRGSRSCAAARGCGRSADRARRPRARAGQVDGVGAERIARRSRRRARRRRRPRRPIAAPVGAAGDDGGTLLMPWVMYSSTSSRVTPCAASSCAAYDLVCWSVAASTSPDCTSCRPALCTCSTAVCSTRRNASVCSGSFCWPRGNCSIVLVEVLVEVAAELRQIGAAGGEDPLAVGVVRQRVEQVLERQVRMPPRRSPRGTRR